MKAAVAWHVACAYTPSRSAPPAEQARGESAPIDTLDLRAHTYFLAHDRLAGRGTGAPGGDLAALYLAAQCRASGLDPVGPEYFQTVSLVEVAVGPRTMLTLERHADRRVFRHPEHFILDFGALHQRDTVAGPLVYVNTPIRPEALPDLRGAVVTTLGPAGTPDQLAVLKERGAAAILQLGAERQVFELYVRSRGHVRLSLSDTTIPSSLTPPVPVIIAGQALTWAVLEGTPLNTRQPMPNGPLGRSVVVGLDAARRSVSAPNVACLLRGAAGARDTAIAFTAHYDHLGVGSPDTRGDSIYNGFSDNAAGVAMLLAMARALQHDPRPRHSVLFLFFTGEEQGLLGSDYYVARPLWPLSRLRAVINLDAGAPAAALASWRLAGGEGSALGLLAVDVALARGWSATVSAARPNSDYFPFHRHGVPAIAVIPGPGPYEGLTTDSSTALRRRWDFYHQPGDEWSADFPMAGLRRYAEYAYLIAMALDRGLKAGEETRARR